MSGSTAGASLSEIKNIKLAGNAAKKFLPREKTSKLRENKVLDAKLSEAELQENTYQFQNMKKADKASANAMKYPKNHKDSEEAYMKHSDAHDAAMGAASSGYGYNSGNTSLATKKKYLDMASTHLDHMMHHTKKEFGESVETEGNLREAETENAHTDVLKGLYKKHGQSELHDKAAMNATNYAVNDSDKAKNPKEAHLKAANLHFKAALENSGKKLSTKQATKRAETHIEMAHLHSDAADNC